MWVAEVRTPFCFVLKYPMLGPVVVLVEEDKKITQLVKTFPEGFRISSCYSPAFATFGL